MSRAAKTVYFDGGCPICRREITWYRSWRGSDRIDWIDLTQDEIDPSLDRCALMARFTVEREDGSQASGAAGFIAMWRALPASAGPARLIDNRLMTWGLERAYRGFLALRSLWRTSS
ncbi:MAG: DCC1-like thiol-disulfide oxidoreductase family protein [Pseudomonadota bacterium]